MTAMVADGGKGLVYAQCCSPRTKKLVPQRDCVVYNPENMAAWVNHGKTYMARVYTHIEGKCSRD